MTLTPDDLVRLQDAIDSAAAFVVELGSTSGGWESDWPEHRRQIPARIVADWLDRGMPPAHVIVAANGSQIVETDDELADEPIEPDVRPPARPRRASTRPPSSRRP